MLFVIEPNVWTLGRLSWSCRRLERLPQIRANSSKSKALLALTMNEAGKFTFSSLKMEWVDITSSRCKSGKHMIHSPKVGARWDMEFGLLCKDGVVILFRHEGITEQVSNV